MSFGLLLSIFSFAISQQGVCGCEGGLSCMCFLVTSVCTERLDCHNRKIYTVLNIGYIAIYLNSGCTGTNYQVSLLTCPADTSSGCIQLSWNPFEPKYCAYTTSLCDPTPASSCTDYIQNGNEWCHLFQVAFLMDVALIFVHTVFPLVRQFHFHFPLLPLPVPVPVSPPTTTPASNT